MADPPPSVIPWTDIVAAIGIVVTAGLVVLGLILAFFQIRALDKSRDIEALTSRSLKWEEPPLAKARLTVTQIGDARELWNHLNALEPGLSEEWYLFMRIPHFFEDMGIACLQAHAVDKKIVYEMFAPPIEHYWGVYRTFMEEYRKKLDDQRLFEWFEKLATEMLRMKAKRPH